MVGAAAGLALSHRRRLSGHRIIEAQVFDEDEGIELLEGVIVRKSPRTADLALVVERLSDPLFVALPAEYVIVGLGAECLELHTDPDRAAGRLTSSTLGKEAVFASTAVPGLKFSVRQLFA